MSRREHDEPTRHEELKRVYRENGTLLERVTGWLLTYPVRTMIIALVLVMILTFSCGL